MLDLSKTYIHTHTSKSTSMNCACYSLFVNFFSLEFLFSIKIATLCLNQTKESNKREDAYKTDHFHSFQTNRFALLSTRWFQHITVILMKLQWYRDFICNLSMYSFFQNYSAIFSKLPTVKTYVYTQPLVN